MKELFDRHEEKLSEAEDRRVWSAMFDETKRAHPWWRNWGSVSVIATVATAAVAVVVVTQQPERVMVNQLAGSNIEVRVNKVASPPSEDFQDAQKKEARTDLDALDSKPSGTRDVALDDELEGVHPPPFHQSQVEHLGKVAGSETSRDFAAELEEEPVRRKRAETGDQPAAKALAMSNAPEPKAKVAMEQHPGGVIRGRVTTTAGEPLRYANVLLEGTSIGALSDSLGHFVIRDVPPGEYTVHADQLGYETAYATLTVETGSNLELACNLAKNSEGAATLRGRVTNEAGEPLAFVNVMILGTYTGAMTDSNGEFEIPNLASGKYTVKVSYIGYYAEEKVFTLETNQELAGVFELSEAAVEGLEDATVEADQELIRRNESSTEYPVADEELERLPVDTFQESLALESGVASQAGDLQLRGGRAGEVPAEAGAVADAPASSPPDAKKTTANRKISFDKNQGEPIAVGGSAPVNGIKYDAMFFEHYGVNPFMDPRDDRFATFAVDVDNASFTLARNYLQRGALPPKDAIRVEEFVNSFNHNYAPPRDELMADRRWAPSRHGTFAIHLDAAPSPFGNDLVLMRVGLKGREVHARDRKPATLTFVVDVSGSMNRENRLGMVKQSLHMLLDQMNSDDEVGLVVYGSNARVICPPTPLEDRAAIERAIDQLRAGGSTYAEAGLRAGYELAERHYRKGRINRVILCSDGVANVGQTGADGILTEIKAQTGKGIYLTAVGFGMGNYNDVLMEKLANQGDGNYYYVDRLDEARKVFVENLTGTLQTIARDVKIQVEFDGGSVRRYRLLGYENRDVADKDFRNDKVDAGEVGAGHEVTALFELRLEGRSRHNDMATVRIRYEDPETGKVTEEARTVRVEDIVGRFDKTDPTFKMDAAVAEFAEIMRHSYWARDGKLSETLGVAREAARELGNPQELTDLVSMIESAWNLWPAETPAEWNDDVRPTWEPENDRR